MENTSDFYTAMDIYFLENDDATIEKWNELSTFEKSQYDLNAWCYNNLL